MVDAYFSHLSVVDQVQNDAKVKFDCLVDLNLKPYGRAFDRTSFFRGEITTIKCFENNPLVRETLAKGKRCKSSARHRRRRVAEMRVTRVARLRRLQRGISGKGS